MEQEPDDGGAAARQADRPPVGEPLVVSRRNPAARPAVAVAEPVVAVTGSAVPGPGVDGSTPVPVGPLEGRVVLLTEAGGELGSAFAAALVDRGARVLLVDRDLDAVVATADGLPTGRAVPIRCDLGSLIDVEAVCGFVALAATVDAVVHVAPSEPDADLDDQFRRRVRGPVDLVAGLGAHLAPAAPVLLVDRPSDAPADGVGRVAPDLLRERLELDGRRVCAAECGPELASPAFAGAVVDLLVRDDVAFERLVLDAAGAARSDGGAQPGR